MWWEIRKLALVVFVADAVVASVCLVACLLLGAFTREGIGTALFIGAFVLVFASVGFGGVRLPDSGARMTTGSLYERQRMLELEMDTGTTPTSLMNEMSRKGGMSSPLALGFAAIPMLAASAIVIGAVG